MRLLSLGEVYRSPEAWSRMAHSALSRGLRPGEFLMAEMLPPPDLTVQHPSGLDELFWSEESIKEWVKGHDVLRRN